ncbi:DUF1090 family protein [Helicobacter sp. 11S02596-1]|uniref:DUF1090 family protein n=1 Tax=Helicobacter sp. 11S02596-1 TaxID=1476194 RepID=UPI000BA797A7|nr:DUF1090 family protein [Helicobacter sp. 11S02596-1]PAF41622.1 hypothetical protein BJI48_08000 [Helicobacter sp. 11S02596-1]
MQKIVLVCILSFVFGYAGPICDFKINDAKAQIQYAIQKNLNANIPELQKNLQKLEKTCKDSDILDEIHQNIQATQSNLDQVKMNLDTARTDGNAHKIRQAQIEFKIANMQYIAAKQELLRMQDLLKSQKNVK